MKYEFIYYISDGSFDYGDFTHYETDYHGFDIEINSDNIIDINTLIGFGDYTNIEKSIKSLIQFKDFLYRNFRNITEYKKDCYYSNFDIFEDLLLLVEKQIALKKEVA